MHIRDKIYSLVAPPTGREDTDPYDLLMMTAIVVSIIPLAFKQTNTVFTTINHITVVLFIMDYILRWATADKLLDDGVKSFFVYPFTFSAIIDLLSLLPGLAAVNQGLKLLRLVRLIRMFRIFRIFRAIRYSRSVAMIARVISKNWEPLVAVCYIALGYILVTALIIFNVEPDTFETFFDALYWATISLTTVGYGDIFAVSMIGRIITMISSICGIAIVAMPAGIITAGIIDELQ